jgi:Peptidase C65 Otubain
VLPQLRMCVIAASGVTLPPAALAQAHAFTFMNTTATSQFARVALCCTHSQRYPHLRQVRGDGNCFYRALTFSLLENLVLRLGGADAAAAEAARAEVARLIAIGE